MKNLEQLSEQEVLFVRVQWPESQTIEDQWWFQEDGFHLDNGDIMVPADYYIRHNNGEDLTHKYSSLEEAKEDFSTIVTRLLENQGADSEDDDENGEFEEEVEDLFENKCGFRRPELITYLPS